VAPALQPGAAAAWRPARFGGCVQATVEQRGDGTRLWRSTEPLGEVPELEQQPLGLGVQQVRVQRQEQEQEQERGSRAPPRTLPACTAPATPPCRWAAPPGWTGGGAAWSCSELAAPGHRAAAAIAHRVIAG
jgi:hypothetical protein